MKKLRWFAMSRGLVINVPSDSTNSVLLTFDLPNMSLNVFHNFLHHASDPGSCFDSTIFFFFFFLSVHFRALVSEFSAFFPFHRVPRCYGCMFGFIPPSHAFFKSSSSSQGASLLFIEAFFTCACWSAMFCTMFEKVPSAGSVLFSWHTVSHFMFLYP